MEFPDFQEIFSVYLMPWSIRLIQAIAIFIIGRWIAAFMIRLVRKAMNKAKLDEMLISFLASILSALLLLIIVVASLSRLGINTTSLVALLGAAGLAIGLALQDSLKNFAAGVMMIIFRPFTKGDFVEAAGVSGTVLQINIFNTWMRTPDNRKIIVANGDIISSPITNFSANETRRIDLVIGIGYDDDIGKAKQIIQRVVEAHDKVLTDPEPFYGVLELGDSSVNITARPWCATGDYFGTFCDLREQVKLALDDAGINIPYPQMDVHIATAAETDEGEPEQKAA